MAIVPKTKVLQIRVDEEFFNALTRFSDENKTTNSSVVRRVVGSWLHQRLEKARKDAEYAATLESRHVAASVAAKADLPLGPALRAVRSVSERMEAKKVGKKAKAAKRHDR